MKFDNTQKYGVTTVEYNQLKGVISSIYDIKLDIVLLEANKSKLIDKYRVAPSSKTTEFEVLLDIIATSRHKRYTKLAELYTVLDGWGVKKIVEAIEGI
jgi:hypothetical protein